MPQRASVGRMALLFCALVPSLADAHGFKIGDLAIGHPWTRATPNGATVAGGYLTITNQGKAPDTLTGGSFEAAKAADIHEMATVNGVMTMRPTGPVALPPGGTVTLAPSGRHFMFTGLTRPLKQGETVAGTLTFEHAGTVPVGFAVEAIGARAPGEAAGHSMPGMTE